MKDCDGHKKTLEFSQGSWTKPQWSRFRFKPQVHSDTQQARGEFPKSAVMERVLSLKGNSSIFQPLWVSSTGSWIPSFAASYIQQCNITITFYHLISRLISERNNVQNTFSFRSAVLQIYSLYTSVSAVSCISVSLQALLKQFPLRSKKGFSEL